MLDDLAVVLFRPKYPENVGSAARACLNMGVENLILVQPRDSISTRPARLPRPTPNTFLNRPA